MDVMNFQINRISDTVKDYTKVEIVEITKNMISNLITLSGEYISGFTGIFFRYSPFAINIDKYAIKCHELASRYGRLDYGE